MDNFNEFENNAASNGGFKQHIQVVTQRVVHDYLAKYKSITHPKRRLIEFDIQHKEQEFSLKTSCRESILTLFNTDNLDRIVYGLEELHMNDLNYSFTQAVWRLDIIRALREVNYSSVASEVSKHVFPLFPADLYSTSPIYVRQGLVIPRLEYLMHERDLLVEYYHLSNRDVTERHL